jgi:hypothetical protein
MAECKGGSLITMFKNIDSSNHPHVLHEGVVGTIHKKVKLPPCAGKGDCVMVDCLPVCVLAPCPCHALGVLLDSGVVFNPLTFIITIIVVVILLWSVPILLVVVAAPWC